MNERIKKKLIAALKRSGWTMLEVFVTLAGTDTVGVTDLDWLRIGNICLMAGILAFAKSLLVGMPEHDDVEIHDLTS